MWILNHALVCVWVCFCFFHRVIRSRCMKALWNTRNKITFSPCVSFYHLVAIFIKEFYLTKNFFFSAAMAVVVVAILQFSNFLKALKRGLYIFMNAYITSPLWRYFVPTVILFFNNKKLYCYKWNHKWWLIWTARDKENFACDDDFFCCCCNLFLSQFSQNGDF